MRRKRSSTCAGFHPKQSDLVLTGVAETEYQNSGVQTFAYRHVAVSYRLAANTAYTAYSWFSQLAAGGSWQYYQGNQYLFMRGAAWAL